LIKAHFNAISERRKSQITMCDEQAQQENALISAQNHGTILVMVAWFLACLLVQDSSSYQF
jgi:hypothetical protein